MYLQILLLGILLACSATTRALNLEQSIHKFERAKFFLLESETPPERSQASIEVSLPDIWEPERYKHSDNGWYSIFFTLDNKPEHALAILLPKVNMNVAVFLNGEAIGDGGRFEEPMSRNWSKPLSFIASAHLFAEGENRLDIRLKSFPAYGQLSTVYIGPKPLIGESYNKLYFIQVTITAVMLMGLMILALLVFTFWLRRRYLLQYFWFMISILAWSILPLNMITTDIPVNTKLWEWFCHSAVALWVVSFTLFVHHFIQKPARWLQYALLLYVALVSFKFAVIPLHEYQGMVVLSYSLNLVIGMYAILRLVAALLSRRLRGTIPLTLCSMILLSLGIHDWAVQTGIIFSENNLPIYLNYLIMPIFFLFIGWYLMDEFVRTLNEVESLNQNLELKMLKVRNELEEKYKTIQEIETQKKIYEERQRLSREIHDGVSGSLTNSLMLTEIIKDKSHDNDEVSQRITQLNSWLRNSLSDIRNLIFSLDSAELSGLEIFHYISDKYRDTFYDMDINLSVHIEKEQDSYTLSQTQSLNLLKVLQECMNNILKHSEASEVKFSLRECAQHITFAIEDNGTGFDLKDKNREQHGISNMVERCQEIHATIHIDSKHGKGTRIEVSLS